MDQSDPLCLGQVLEIEALRLRFMSGAIQMDDNPYQAPKSKPSAKPQPAIERVYLGIAVVAVLGFAIVFGGGFIWKSLPWW